MKFILYEKEYKIKNKNIIGTLIDCQYNEDKKENIYILEERNEDKDGKYPLYDVWEHEIEEVNDCI